VTVLYEHGSCKLPAFGELDAFRKTADPGIDGVSLLFELHAHVPKIIQWDIESLDEFTGFELRLRILVFRQRKVDRDVDHAYIRIAEAGIY
jgi:hypothetical protein